MPNDPLIEAITAGMFANLPDDCGLTPEGANTLAQAALAALKAEGVMLCRWEPTDDQGGSESFRRTFDLHPLRGYKLTGLEPPAAALAGRPDA